jgi:folate-binding protein YgfZ
VAITEVDLDAQYRVLREGAGVVRRGGRRRLAVTGAEATDYLQGQLTNEVEALAAGEGCYAALLDRKGHMQGDMRLLHLAGDAFELETEAEAGDAILRHLSMYKVGREVEVEDVSERAMTLSVIGPAARELSGTGPLSPEHAHRQHPLAGVDTRAVATDLGVDLIVPGDGVEAIEDELAHAGAEPVSEAAAEIVRVESGFSKGCYIGQETVARLHYRGKPNRHLRGLRLGGPGEAGDPVRLGDRELGSIGTAVVSPAHGQIALAILRREAEPGATVTVGEGVEAELVDLPFV